MNNVTNVVNNPMAQLARMYQLIEEVLRRAARDNKVLTIPEIRADANIVAAERSPWQVRDILGVLEKKGHVIKSGGGRKNAYMWDVESPPFVLHSRVRERIATDPSVPVVVNATMPAAVTTPAAVTNTTTLQNKDIEFVFHGVEFIVGINPKTGNLRLKIEKESS